MEISYRQGNELFELLSQNEFIRKIDKLYKSCEWSTAYQSTSFNKSWYRAYRNEYTPLVAYIEKGNNLTDFAWFAKKNDSDEIIVAGGHQTAYKMWMSLSHKGKFIKQVIDEFFKKYGLKKIDFTYVSELVAKRLLDCKILTRKSIYSEKELPLVNFELGNAIEKFSSRKNRKKINRLFRIENIEVIDCNGKAELEPIIEDNIRIHDLRMGSAFGVCPFKLDKNKKKFLLNLSESRIFYNSVIKTDKDLISFNMGIKDRKSYYTGLAGFSPVYSKFSPGVYT